MTSSVTGGRGISCLPACQPQKSPTMDAVPPRDDRTLPDWLIGAVPSSDPLIIEGRYETPGGRLLKKTRDDIVPLPPVGEEWFLDTDGVVAFTRDHAAAPTNGAEEVWPGKVQSIDCHVHASTLWVPDHRGLIAAVDKKDMQGKLIGDLMELKNCPHAQLAEPMKDAMITKWRDVYKEPEIAQLWKKVYGGCMLTRVELNTIAMNPLHGGMPVDNNITEVGNRDDKAKRKHKKQQPIAWIHDTARHMFRSSASDLDYTGDMKPKVSTMKDLYKPVHEEIALYESGDPSIVHPDLHFAFSSVHNGVPVGSFLLTSAHTIGQLTSADFGFQTTDEISSFLRNGRRGEEGEPICCMWLTFNQAAWQYIRYICTKCIKVRACQC